MRWTSSTAAALCLHVSVLLHGEMKSAASSENTLTLILDSVTIATSIFLHVRIHVLKTKFCLSEAAKKNQSALSSIKSF